MRAVKAGWACEQAHQQLKDELGLDHFEGRSWLGLHHHALLSMMAFAYLQHHRLLQAAQSGEKTKAGLAGAAPAAVAARGTARHHRRAAAHDLRPLPSLRGLREHVPA